MGSDDRRRPRPPRSTAATSSRPCTPSSRRPPQKAPLLLVIEDTHWADQSTRDMLSFLFSRPFDGPVAIVASYRADDLHRRHPLRRQVAEWSRHPRRPAGRPLAAARGRGPRADRRAGPRGPGRGRARRHRRPGRGQRVLRRGAHQRRRRAGQLGPRRPRRRAPRPRSTGSTTTRARWSARPASRAAGSPTTCSPRPPASTTPQLDEGLRKAVEMNVLVAGDGHYSFRHALLGEAVYDDLLPGERVRLHAQYVVALQSGDARGTAAELARHARLAMDLDTALTASVQAGTEASQVGGPDEAAYHYQQALELLADPRRCEQVDLDLSKLVVSAADALTRQRRPAARGGPPAGAARPAARRDPAGLAGPDAHRPRPGDDRDRHRRGPGRRLRRGGRARARGRQRPARAGAHQPRARARRAWGGTTRRRSSAWTLSPSPSASTSTSWPPRRSPRSAA